MGCTLSKCCRGGENKRTRYESVSKGSGEEPTANKTLSSATDHVTGSFQSVYKATLERFDLNHDTLGNIQELKHELLDNPQLISFIEDYLNTSIETLDFFSLLDKRLREAHSTVYLANRAVYLFETGAPGWAVLKDLEDLREQGNPFQPFPKTTEVELQRLCELHRSRIQKLLERQQVLNQKHGKVEQWKRILSWIGLVGISLLFISSTVLAIMTGPVAALTVLGLAGCVIPQVLDKGINPLLDKLKSSTEGERDTIVDLKKQASVAIHELDSINALVKELEVYVNSVDGYARFPLEGEHDDEEEKVVKMKIAMYDIKTKAERLKTGVEDLKKEVNLRRENLRTAVTTILMAVKNNKYECVSCV